MCERELETGQNYNILTPTLLAITAFFPVLLGCSTGGLGAQPPWDIFLKPVSSLQLQLLNRCWVLAFSTASYLQLVWSPTATAYSGTWGTTLLGAGFLYRILSSSDLTSSALSYIIVQRSPSSCGRHKSHSFNPSMVKLIFWYSSTGCTCYLHRCISFFDSLAGAEFNIQQKGINIISLLEPYNCMQMIYFTLEFLILLEMNIPSIKFCKVK